jgi:hypothetical protein
MPGTYGLLRPALSHVILHGHDDQLLPPIPHEPDEILVALHSREAEARGVVEGLIDEDFLAVLVDEQAHLLADFVAAVDEGVFELPVDGQGGFDEVWRRHGDYEVLLAFHVERVAVGVLVVEDDAVAFGALSGESLVRLGRFWVRVGMWYSRWVLRRWGRHCARWALVIIGKGSAPKEPK